MLSTFLRTKQKKVNESFDFPLSVIVCGRNEAKNIKQNLPKVLQQYYAAGFEVVFVNDASSDNSQVVLEELTRVYSHLTVLHLTEEEKEGKGKKGAVKVGIANAKHEALVFTDADCYPKSKFWLQQMAKALAKQDVVLGYGPLQRNNGLLNALCLWETANVAAQYFTFTHFKMPYMAVGRNMAYKKTIYNQVGGFEKHMHLASGDDDLFVLVARTKSDIGFTLNKESFMFSEAPKSWKALFLQKQRHLSTAYHYNLGVQLLLGGLGVAQLLFYLLLPFALVVSCKIALLITLVKIAFQYLGLSVVFTKLKNGKKVWLTPIYEVISLLIITVLHLKKYTVGTKIKWK